MVIILYRECILTDSYSEVFDVISAHGGTALERYLDGLNKIEVHADNVYVPRSGRITLQLDIKAFDWNYMQVINEQNGFHRYCFIDDITVINGSAIISYVEDVWSNYAPYMNVRKSLLTRSRVINYDRYAIPFYAPGMEYQGNNCLSFLNIDFRKGLIEEGMLNAEVNVIFQLQLYQLAEEGEYSKRIVNMAALFDETNSQWEMDIRVAETMLQTIYSRQGIDTVNFNGEDYYYELYDILLVPRTLGIPQTRYIFSSEQIKCVAGTTMGISFVNSVTIDPLYICGSIKIPNNWQTFKIGLMSEGYDIVQNGTDMDVCIYITTSFIDFKIYLGFQNQIIEITDNFRYELPISVQTADVTQQQKTARELKALNAKMQIAQGGLQVAKSFTSATSGAASMAYGASTGSMRDVFSGASAVNNAPYETATGIMNIIGGRKNLEVANRAMFTTNRGSQTSIESRLNAVNGIVLYRINPDNMQEVADNIDNVGYVVNEVVDGDVIFGDGEFLRKNYGWNVVQFDYVNLSGAFPQRTASVLREILTNGVKIWYDEERVYE